MAKVSDNEFPKIILTEGSVPSNPISGDQKLFIDIADHKLKRVNSGGSVVTIEGGGSGGGSQDYILIQDQKPSGTVAGAIAIGSWGPRDLNTKVSDTGGHASLESNQIRLEAGIYRVFATCPGYKCDSFQARLYDITGDRVLVWGTPEFSWHTDNTVSISRIVGTFTLNVESVLEIQQQGGDASGSTNGLGIAASLGQEIYTTVELWKNVVSSDSVIYFVDPVIGNDSYDGLSKTHSGLSGPWRTFAKVMSATIKPDDSVLLNAGTEFRGQNIEAKSSGTAGHPIIYGRYGIGPNPIINPTLVYQDFVLDSGSIWKRTVTFNPVQVFEDDVRLSWHNGTDLIAGQWFHTGTTLYIRCSDNGNPNSAHVIEHRALFSSPAFAFNGQSWINVDGIDIKKPHAGYGFKRNLADDVTPGSRNCNISNAVITWGSFRGVDMGGYDDLLMSNHVINTLIFHDLNAEAVWVGNGSNHQVLHCEAFNGRKDADKFAETPDGGGIDAGIRSVNVLIEDNYIHDCYSAPLEVENEAGYPRPIGTILNKNKVTQNVDLGSGALVGDEGFGTLIIDNILKLTASAGSLINLRDGSSGNMVYHNHLVHDTVSDVNSFNLTNNSGADIRNNLLYRNGKLYAFYIHPTTGVGFTLDHNCYFGTTWAFDWSGTSSTLAAWRTKTGQEANSIVADPLFVAPVTDLHLQSGSPCKNTGADLRALVPTDFDGVTRDATPDIGAYEYA